MTTNRKTRRATKAAARKGKVPANDSQIDLDPKDRTSVEKAYMAVLEARAARDQLLEQKMILEQRIGAEATPRVNEALQEFQRVLSRVGYKHGVDEESAGAWTLSEDRKSLVQFDPATMQVVNPVAPVEDAKEE